MSEPTEIKGKQIEKKTKEAKAPSKKVKLKYADIYRTMADAINHKSFSSLDPLPQKFLVIEPERGIRQVLEVDDQQVCRAVDPETVTDAILNYVDTNKRVCDNELYKFEVRHARECMTRWLKTAPVHPKPADVLFANQQGLTFSRLPWDYDPNAECPTFDDIFQRMTNAKAAKCFIGSIFFKDSYRQQYLYLCGEGQNGKGSIISFLDKALGDASIGLTVPVDTYGNLKDPYFFGQVYGKRLGYFDDLQMLNFPASGTFKSLTGHDYVTINNKYEKPFKGKITMKVIITSNDLPVIPGDDASRRRIILCPIDSTEVTGNPMTYEQTLWAEGGAFLSKCIDLYNKTLPDHGQIRAGMDDFDLLAEQEARPHERIFEALFTYTGDENDFVQARDFVDALQRFQMTSNKRINEFKRWLHRTHKVRCARLPVHLSSSRAGGYRGIVINDVAPDLMARHGQSWKGVMDVSKRYKR